MTTPEPVSFAHALRFWARLGCISFGGPAGQIAIMHAELVERRRWISDHRFTHALNYCMVLPGPEAQQLATYIGWLMHGIKGGIAAGLLFILPSLLLLLMLSWAYLAFGDVGWVSALLYGVKPAVVAIIVHASGRIAGRVLTHPLLWAISVTAFVSLTLLHVPFPAVIAGAALLGLVGGKLLPDTFRPAAPARRTEASRNAFIDDHTPTPGFARFTRRRLLSVLLAGVLLWLAPYSTLAVAIGAHDWLATLAEFFTKAALLTFGGAYAVLPYVAQAAVVEHGWLSVGQMMDGLALGETTPGPLIMVVTFVGFVGGWQHGTPDAAVLSGIAGALVATYFTFLPSFIFIFAGGPLVESTRTSRWLAAPMTGITAAVVGVILNLGLLFGLHTVWPNGLSGGVDVLALSITLAALLSLARFGTGVPLTLLACGLVGVALKS